MRWISRNKSHTFFLDRPRRPSVLPLSRTDHSTTELCLMPEDDSVIAQPPRHPSDQTLQAYGLGTLDESSSSSVDAHLEDCLDCRRRVGEVSSDTFLGGLREAGARLASPGGGLLRTIASRCSTLSPRLRRIPGRGLAVGPGRAPRLRGRPRAGPRRHGCALPGAGCRPVGIPEPPTSRLRQPSTSLTASHNQAPTPSMSRATLRRIQYCSTCRTPDWLGKEIWAARSTRVRSASVTSRSASGPESRLRGWHIPARCDRVGDRSSEPC